MCTVCEHTVAKLHNTHPTPPQPLTSADQNATTTEVRRKYFPTSIVLAISAVVIVVVFIVFSAINVNINSKVSDQSHQEEILQSRAGIFYDFYSSYVDCLNDKSIDSLKYCSINVCQYIQKERLDNNPGIGYAIINIYYDPAESSFRKESDIAKMTFYCDFTTKDQNSNNNQRRGSIWVAEITRDEVINASRKKGSSKGIEVNKIVTEKGFKLASSVLFNENGFIFGDSDNRNLTKEEVLRKIDVGLKYTDPFDNKKLDKKQVVQYMINEISARKGREFGDNRFRAHYLSLEWYSPTKKSGEYTFNSVEAANRKLLSKIRDSQ
ncbi:MAG: YARHG domain-containing protein [Eubacteriaceae bacterium]|nr:YARHG domain-containing protein [Eubacteriaceae bacterium]